MKTLLESLRIIVAAAGSQSRWGAYQNVNKLLLPIHGEPLLERTLRQLRERKVDEIFVIDDPHSPTELPSTGIGHSVQAWGMFKRNVILFGDVAWSDPALDQILACREPAITWFGRSGPGQFNRSHRELFGLSIPTGQQSVLRHAINAFAAIRPPGMTCGGWPLYAMLQGRPWNSYEVRENFVEIDDETDDFDTPGDYSAWRKLFETNPTQPPSLLN